MRFTSTATGIFCLVSLVAAYPVNDNSPDACCCCDISKNVISCNTSILKEDCVCAAVMCPANAPTVYHGGKPRATPMPKATKAQVPPVQETAAPLTQIKSPNPEDACCCCDPTRDVMSCSSSISKKECVCAAVVCSANAPMVWENEIPIIADLSEPNPAEVCCCCNPTENVMSCTASISKKECVCAAVVCPANAPFVWAKKPVAVEPKKPNPAETCCCCNPTKKVMSCTKSISKKNCVCAAVVCPANAPFVWA